MAHSEGRYSRVFRTIGVTGIAFVINYLITLFLTPYITDRVGTEVYGFVSLAKNIAQYATIATLALNAFATRYIAIAWHENDIERANVYCSSAFFGDLALGSVIFGAACVGIIFIDRIFIMPAEYVGDIQLLFLMVFIKFLMNTVFTVSEAGPAIADKLDKASIYKLLSYVVEAGILFTAYRILKPRVWYIGVGLVAAAAVIIISNISICRRYTPGLKISRKLCRMNAIRRLLLDGIWSVISDLGALLHSGLDLVICNLMLSPLAMGQLSIAKEIDLIFHSLYQLVGRAFQPMLLKSYAEKNTRKLLEQLGLAMKLSGYLSNLAFAGFFALGIAYFRLWIPNQDIELIYHLTIITILTSVASGPMSPLYYIYTLTVKQKIPCLVTVTTGFMNLFGMIILIRYTNLGIDAVVWTTVVLIWFINFVSNPVYMAHVLGLPIGTFYPGIVRNVLSCAAMSISFKLLSGLYMPATWITLFISAGVLSVVGLVIHFAICFTHAEQRKIIQAVASRFGHK